MSDLIDRKRLWEERPEWLNVNHVDNSEYNRGWNDCNDYWLEIIGKLPIAYDVEDVVLTLQQWRDYYDNHIEYYGATENIKAYEHAIEIVKRGGVDDQN